MLVIGFINVNPECIFLSGEMSSNDIDGRVTRMRRTMVDSDSTGKTERLEGHSPQEKWAPHKDLHPLTRTAEAEGWDRS